MMRYNVLAIIVSKAPMQEAKRTYWVAGAKREIPTLAIPAQRTDVACSKPFMTLQLTGSASKMGLPMSKSMNPAQSIMLQYDQ